MITIKKKTKVILPVQLPMDMYQLLRKAAYDKKVKMAAVVRQSLEEYLY
jgi:hypothetical protein